MTDIEQPKVDQALDRMAGYDALFIIPMMALFSYLPAVGWWSMLVNGIIVILTGFGLAYITHTIIHVYQKRKNKRTNMNS